MKTVLLTRSLEENLEFELGLNECNFKFISCPLIHYNDLKFDHQILDNYSNLIITSKHAAQILAATSYSRYRSLNIWVVGELSAQILVRAGFSSIQCVAMNIDDLMTHLPRNLYKNTIYLAANEITKNLSKKICKKIIYDVSYTKELNLKQLEQLQEGVDYILLYSQNCAKTLIDLLLRFNLLKILENTVVIAISLKVANIMNGYCSSILHSNATNQAEIIRLLINHAKQT